ncbi:hypothetical protein [Tsukamurella tyrosinosolvens]|uniref:DUF7426 family protein n=1 Tax=Tsukamurella tyrosinosolvens TaxID=57704 RepID=UPI003462CD3F
MPVSPFPDLRDFYDPALTLPVGGKTYRIAAPSQADTLAVREVVTGGVQDATEYLDRLFRLLGAERTDTGVYVGGLVDEMTADGLVWNELVRVAETAALHFGDGEERARAWWAAELHAAAVAQAVADEAQESEKPKPRKATKKAK